MTKKQIEKKAKEIVSRFVPNEDDDEFLPPFYAQKVAICMADWALSHQWVSVEDELPKVGEKVLIKHQYGSQVAARFRYNEKITNETFWGLNSEMPIGADITHWMPIPPIAEEGGEK